MTIAQTQTLIDTVVASHLAADRSMDCELIVWLQTQSGRADTVALRKEMMARPEWTPFHSLEAIYALAGQESTPARTAALNLYGEHALTEDYSWPGGGRLNGIHRAMIERIATRKGDGLPPSTWRHLIAWLKVHHPNPKLFLAQPHILENVPASIDLSDLPSPARPRFQAEKLKGGRAGA